MSDFIETLWSQFGIETLEHIEEIEQNLLETECSGTTPERIRILFRAFHSLKGLATAMDMASLARLAHRAEDILGVIRDGDFPLNSDVISLLLAVVDEIKALRQSRINTHTNTEANTQLMEDLSEKCSSMGPAQKDISPADSEELHRVSDLRADREILGYFLELVQAKVAIISQVLEPLVGGSESTTVPENGTWLDAAVTEIEALAYAARTMGFFSLVDTLNALRIALPTDSLASDLQQGVILECLLELHDKICYIESSSGIPEAAANPLQPILSAAMHSRIEHILRQCSICWMPCSRGAEQLAT